MLITNGKFYEEKIRKNNYSPALKNCIELACNYCLESINNAKSSENGNKPIMMLGKIQSGKTRAYTGLMALAFDNAFDMVIILTKNSSALVKQTYKRMRFEFIESINNNEVEIFDIMKKLEGRLTEYELDKKLIVIAKKETRNLDKIINFILEYTLSLRKFCLIIDDEADTTGIGYSKVDGSINEFDLRTIASKVNNLRGNFGGAVFVQVTATPYALYLQPEFSNSKIEPVKPGKTVLVPSGEDYVGGEYYFIESKKEESPAAFIFEEVPSNELDIIRKSDRRRFKEEEILLRNDKLTIFKRGIINFIVGGCVLRGYLKNAHFSFVIHTNTEKSSHERIELITEYFFEGLHKRSKKTEKLIDQLFDESYSDIEKSFRAYGFEIPPYEQIKKEFFVAIDKDLVSTTIVNSDKDVDSILQEETGELKLRTPFSLFIGGQVLDRGVTIPNMIGFYYGRNPNIMQQDTVLQHSRMFGYRKEKKLLAVTRFYTTRRIYENMTKITEIDTALRIDIENKMAEKGVYFIREDELGRIVPCSPDKIKLSKLLMLGSCSRYFPIGFTPIAKTKASLISKEINKKIVKLFSDESKETELVDCAKLEELIELAYKAIQPDKDSTRFISYGNFLSIMRYLTKNDQKVFLLVRRNRKISKFKKNGNLYSDSPDTPQDETKIANRLSASHPVLMMIHQDGTADGWNGSEFWWPIIYSQKSVPRTIFALEDLNGKIRNV